MSNNNKDDNTFVELFDDDATVTLLDEDDNPTEFYEVASVEYMDKFYEILQPVEPMEGLEDGEAIIFEYDIDETNDEKMFKLVYDEEILEAVFELYLKAEADAECENGDSAEGGCGGCHGCGSGGCGGHHHDDGDDDNDDE